MVAAWEPGDTEKGNDADSMKKLFLNAMLKEIGRMLAKMTDKVKAVEVKTQKEPVKETEKEKVKVKEPVKDKETVKEPEKEPEKVKAPVKAPVKETEETEDTKKPGNNEITTLFQLLHAENRNLRWK